MAAFILPGLILLAATSTVLESHTAKFHAMNVNVEISRLNQLSLVKGMNRMDAEEQIANLLGKPNTYSPYGNNLLGGVVTYRDRDWILKITYKAGVPAPWVLTQDGAKHYPPIDETIVDYNIGRAP